MSGEAPPVTEKGSPGPSGIPAGAGGDAGLGAGTDRARRGRTWCPSRGCRLRSAQPSGQQSLGTPGPAGLATLATSGTVLVTRLSLSWGSKSTGRASPASELFHPGQAAPTTSLLPRATPWPYFYCPEPLKDGVNKGRKRSKWNLEPKPWMAAAGSVLRGWGAAGSSSEQPCRATDPACATKAGDRRSEPSFGCH